MFGYKLIKKKEFKFLKIRNKELFIQTKDLEKEVELLKQEITFIKTEEKQINSKLIKNNEQRESFVENIQNTDIEELKEILSPLKRLNEVSKKISERDLEIIKYLANGKHTIPEMCALWNMKNTAMTVALHRIRKKLIHFNIVLKEEILMDNTKKFYVDRNDLNNIFQHYM